MVCIVPGRRRTESNKMLSLSFGYLLDGNNDDQINQRLDKSFKL